MLVVIARLLLAGVFVVSAVAKFRDRPGARTAVEQFGVPRALVGLVAAALPIVELVCAVLLLTADPGATLGAVGSALLLIAFTIAITVNLRRGRRFSCHCFGQVSGGEIGWPTVARNLVLLSLAGVSLLDAGFAGSVPSVLAQETADERGLWVLVGILAVLVSGLVLALQTLMGRYGSVLLRLEALEQVAGTAPPKEAPSFVLPDLDGLEVALDDVLDAGKPVLLVFLSATCHLCDELLPELAAWQADPDHPASVVVLSNGSVSDNRAKLDGADVRLALQKDFEVADAYGVTGTPTSVVVGVDGRIAAAPAGGVDGVRGQHELLVVVASGHDPVLHQVGPRPVAPNDPLPDLELLTEAGTSLSLNELSNNETVLVFWRTSCGFCAAIAEQVSALEAFANVALISGSPLEEVRAGGLISPVFTEQGAALSRALSIPGTPAAVRIANGRIASEVAVGGPATLELVAESRWGASARV